MADRRDDEWGPAVRILGPVSAPGAIEPSAPVDLVAGLDPVAVLEPDGTPGPEAPVGSAGVTDLDAPLAVSAPAEPALMAASVAAPAMAAPAGSTPADRALVIGLGRSGQAAARHLLARGATVVAVDDNPADDTRAAAAALGVLLVEHPGLDALANLVVRADLVVPSPGVAASHPVHGLARAAGVQVRGELELASRQSICPLVAVTGTNGKSTVTSMVHDMLAASGVASVASGGTGLTLSDALADEGLAVVVTQVSSYQLAFAESFRPAVAVCLNLAPDHLDWHGGIGAYVAAQARVWANQGPTDVAVVNADDPVVMAQAALAPSRVVTFGLGPAPAVFTVVDGWLYGPDGPLLEVAGLSRALPHDVANALAASAAALAAGASVDGVCAALAAFAPLPHRLALVAYAGGVRWYDDSASANPHAAAAAVRGFESVVLIAGGREDRLDLTPLVEVAGRLRAVVAAGDTGSRIAGALAGRCPVHAVGSMVEAVAAAADASRPGDVVVLSPGAAPPERFRSPAERGVEFASAVHALLEARHPH